MHNNRRVFCWFPVQRLWSSRVANDKIKLQGHNYDRRARLWKMLNCLYFDQLSPTWYQYKSSRLGWLQTIPNIYFRTFLQFCPFALEESTYKKRVLMHVSVFSLQFCARNQKQNPFNTTPEKWFEHIYCKHRISVKCTTGL